MRTLLMIAFLIVLLAFGSCCLFFPRSVQAYESKGVSMGITGKCSALSNTYLISVRVTGLIAYAMGLVLAVALYRFAGRGALSGRKILWLEEKGRRLGRPRSVPSG